MVVSALGHRAWFCAVLVPPGSMTTTETWAHTYKEKVICKSPDPFSPSKCGFPGKSEPHAVVSGTRFSTNEEL